MTAISAKTGKFHVGTSGYQYDHWRGVLYPEREPRRRWFEFYCQAFDTVEINNTFYNLPSAEAFERWRDESPGGFTYALKYSRYGTHLKRLKDPQSHVDMFVERAGRLQDNLGPILVQLPPNMKADSERLSAFLEAAPQSMRWSVEVRHPDWLCEEVYEVLREHNVALCLHDMIADHPIEVTADWVYLRYHAAQHDGAYPHPTLAASARRIDRWLNKGLDVYAYFNNDAGGHAVRNAQDLRRYVESSR